MRSLSGKGGGLGACGAGSSRPHALYSVSDSEGLSGGLGLSKRKRDFCGRESNRESEREKGTGESGRERDRDNKTKADRDRNGREMEENRNGASAGAREGNVHYNGEQRRRET